MEVVEGGLDGAFAGSFGAHEVADAGEGGLALVTGGLRRFLGDGVGSLHWWDGVISWSGSTGGR